MPDFLKKAARQTRRECEANEVPLAALFVRPRLGDEIKRLGTPGGALSKVGKFADNVETTEVSVSDQRADMFGQNAILVLTRNRLLAFGHGTYTGRVKRLIGQTPLSTIVGMSLDAPSDGEKGAALMEVRFSDDATFAVTPGSRHKRFVSAFEELAEPAAS